MKLMKESRKIMIRAYFPLLLSHHPYCDKFSEDVFDIRGVKLCVGCTIAYPIALFIVFLWYFDYLLPVHWPYYILFGVIAGLSELFSLKGYTITKKRKIFVKFFLGLGWGLTTIGILSLPLWPPLKYIIFFDLLFLNSALTLKRSNNIDKICESCPEFQFRGSSCSGFILFSNRYSKYMKEVEDKGINLKNEILMIHDLKLNKKQLKKFNKI